MGSEMCIRDRGSRPDLPAFSGTPRGEKSSSAIAEREPFRLDSILPERLNPNLDTQTDPGLPLDETSVNGFLAWPLTFSMVSTSPSLRCKA